MSRVVGLTGGIGSGKSEALRSFARHGAATLSSDEVVRDLYRRDDVRRAVAELVGADMIGAHGEVDRARLAAVVFADPEQRRRLEGLLLPLIAEEFASWRDARLAAGDTLLVHEAPTLFEAGIEDRYDTIVLVTAPAETRRRRRPEAAERMAHQLPEHEKAARADEVYENTGSLEQLDQWVAELVQRLR